MTGVLLLAEVPHQCAHPRNETNYGIDDIPLYSIWCCWTCGRWWGVVPGEYGARWIKLSRWTTPRLWRKAVNS